MLNLKIFHRKIVIGLVEYRSGPKPPLHLELKKNCHVSTKMLEFCLQSDRHCFLDGPLHDAIRRDFFKKVIAIVF